MGKEEILRRIEGIGESQKERKGSKGPTIAFLIGIMVSIVVGINLISSLQDASEGAGTLGAAPPYMFLIGIVFGVVGWFAWWKGDKEGEDSEEELGEVDKIRELQSKKRSHVIYHD